MPDPSWTDEDLQQMKSIGVDPLEVTRQLELFRHPPSPTHLDLPATVGYGIHRLNDQKIHEFLEDHKGACANGRFMKFVPASGAASRMFHLLTKAFQRASLTVEELRRETADGDKESEQILSFFEFIDRFAFYGNLKESVRRKGLELETMRRDGRLKEILEFLLLPLGLGYGQKPKCLIPFHAYPSEGRSPLEEHLVEAVGYARDSGGRCRLHFTVSAEHLAECRDQVQATLASCEKKYDTKFDVDFSVQASSTDTLAVDANNEPFRDEKGRIVFRPGGHGALLDNLGRVGTDLVYIKNIDNIAREHHSDESIRWKRILGGFLVWAQRNIFYHLGKIASGKATSGDFLKAERFVEESLHHPLGEEFNHYKPEVKSRILVGILDRPIRVCGVVPNTGEPGGGPFGVQQGEERPYWEKGGHLFWQIVESAQVDRTSPEQMKIFVRSTHFNPVDLVCGLRNWEGKLFDLKEFVDPKAVFISRKSQGGRELKALELPGLWNGAMAGWITIFVEVPLETFNPVKTVLDLLKPAHQPKV